MRFLWLIGLLLAVAAHARVVGAGSEDPVGTALSGDSTVVVGSIRVTGNKITKAKIVIRELEFFTGEQLSAKKLEDKIRRSSQNLMNRSLFNFVTITTHENNGVLDVTVKVVERWYIWPIPKLSFADRNVNGWLQTTDFSKLNYGLDIRVENFRGRMEYLNFLVQGGYDKKFAVKWTIPYLTKNQFFGMGIMAGVQFNRLLAYTTEENKLVFFNADRRYAAQQFFGQLDFSFRPKFNYFHTLSVAINHVLYNDSLLVLNPSFTYGDTAYTYFEISYLYKHDFRDYAPYPLTGYYFDIGIKKTGLGLLDGDVNQWSFRLVFDQYIHLIRRWYFAYNFSVMYQNSGFQPYFLTTGFGFDGMNIRGYELYAIDGQRLGLMKTNLKFEIIPRKEHTIPWIKSQKFGKVFYALYANLFFDAGYAVDDLYFKGNPLTNQLLYGTGLGIDFITYYDLVFRFEFSLNKQGQTGFYIGLVAPI